VSTRVRLLLDCRIAFEGHDAMPTEMLLERLRADPEAPWGEYGPTGLTARKLAKLLSEYDIESRNIRFPDPLGQRKGYYRTAFLDAWARYCPDPSSTRTETPPGGVVPSVPSVPSSSAQVSAGRIETLGRQRRPTQTSRPSLTSGNDDGTLGTDTPPQPALRVVHSDTR
jgi:hypothetical protein